MFNIRVDYGFLSGIYMFLLLFGIGFDALTAYMERRGFIEGITSLMVVIGVTVTLAPFVLADLPVITVVGGFICSGLPMIVGSITRYIRQREQAKREIVRLHNGNRTEGMAE